MADNDDIGGDAHGFDTIDSSDTASNGDNSNSGCRAPLFEECPQHHGHKEDPGVMLGTCGAIGERTQVILAWVRAPRHWERLPPMETRSHEGKALSIGWLMAL